MLDLALTGVVTLSKIMGEGDLFLSSLDFIEGFALSSPTKSLYLVFSIPSSVTMNCCFILPFSTEHSSESLVTLVLGIYFGTESCNFFVDVGTYSKFSPLLSSGTGARIFLILFFSTSGSFFPVSFSSFSFSLYFFVYKASG
jgi:hypothetical protein